MVTYDNKIWIIGGMTGDVAFNDIHVYDPITNDAHVVNTTGEAMFASIGHSVAVHNGMFYVYSPRLYTNSCTVDQAALFSFDPRLSEWKRVEIVSSRFPTNRFGAGMVIVPETNMIYLFVCFIHLGAKCRVEDWMDAKPFMTMFGSTTSSIIFG
jgi:hypothetical protein